MANSLGTTAVDVIAQEALTRLIQKLDFVKNIHKDFSQTSLRLGQDVITHVITEMSAATFSTDYSTGVQNAVQTDVNITLGTHKHVTFQLTDAERDASSIDLYGRYAEVAAYALAKAIVEELLGSGTLGSNGASITSTPIALSGNPLSMDDLIDLGAEFDAAGIPESQRWLVAHPSVLAGLEKDVQQVSNASFDVSNSIVEGGVNRIRGFNIYGYNGGILSKAGSAVGAVAGFSDSLALVTAPPSSPPNTAGSSLAYITDPSSGLTVQRREWYDADKGIYSFALTLYMGAQLTAGTRMFKITN